MSITPLPDANFTPELAGYSGQGMFRFWCQKVLPITYDDSLSYYELLCKVVDVLNKVIGDMDAVEQNTQALVNAYNELQGYVNNYFDNLDVQTEINNKLDEMAESGELEEIVSSAVLSVAEAKVEELLPTVVEEQIDDVVEEQIGGVVEEQLPGVVNPQIPGAVSNWLDENVDPSSVPVVDTSLTIRGAAADAKATGEYVKLNDKVVDEGFVWKNDIEFEEGYYDVRDGSDTTYLGIKSASKLTNVKGLKIISGTRPLKMTICAYDKTTHIFVGSWNGASYVIPTVEEAWTDLQEFERCYYFPDEYEYGITIFYKVDISETLVSDGLRCYYYSGTDTTLAMPGKAADAKATGDRFSSVEDDIEELTESVGDYNEWINENEPSIMSYNTRENDIDIATYITEELCLLDNPTFEFGDIDTTDGSSVVGNLRIITSNYFTKDDYFAVFIPNEYRTTYGIEVAAYDANNNYIGIYLGSSGFSPSDNTNFIKSLLIKQNYKFKVVVNRYGSTPISITDGENIKFATDISSGGGGGGGEVTPASIVTATGNMTTEQKTQTRTNIGAGEPLTTQQLADAAGAWLEDNLATPSTPPIDSSLSVANAAADAKTVGDKIGELKNATDDLDNRVELYDGKIVHAWEIGVLNQNTNLTPPCVYTHGTWGICTAEGSTIHLYPGDVFSLTNFTGLNINIFGRKTSDNTAVIKAGSTAQTSAIVIEYEGDYALSVHYTDTSVIANLNTLLPLVILQRYSNTIADFQNMQAELEPYADIRPGNLMPVLSAWIEGRVYNGIYSSEITTVKCTDYIPVIGGKTYYIYGGYVSQEYFGVYDANKSVLSGWSFTSVSTDSNNNSVGVIALNANARYIRINLLKAKENSFPTNAYIGLYPNCLPKTLDFSDYVPRIKGNGTLSDKKILVVGDSISTDVYGSYKKWVTDLCENGFFSPGFVTNNSYHATGYVATYTESGVVKQDTFLNRVSALNDLDEYDLIVTFGGINDWIQNIEYYDFTAAVDAYYAYLIEHATQARIAVISPLRTSQYGTSNSASKTQKDYADYIKSVALEYALPLLNLTDESGFCPDKSTTFRDMWTLMPAGTNVHDGVHPTVDWERKYLAPQIAWFLAGLI